MAHYKFPLTLLLSAMLVMNAPVHAQQRTGKGAQGGAPAAPAASASATDNRNLPTLSADLQREGVRWANPPTWLSKPLENNVRSSEVRYTQGRVFEAIFDTHIRVDSDSTVSYTRKQMIPLDNAVIREVSEIPLGFNPAYQKLQLHHLRIIRDGKTIDKSKEARIEVLRREQNLEKRVLDGLKTALIVIPNVQAGDAVDMAYSLEGRNPIFEGHFASLEHVVWGYPIGTRRIIIDAPLSQQLKQQPQGGRDQLQETVVGDRRLLQLQRERIEVPLPEANTPPWFKVYPSVHVTDYQDWPAVHAWAKKLFAVPASDAKINALAQEIRQRKLKPADEVAYVLGMIQEQVRYLSISLGESSHRPKPPAKTWDERLGDCKDKVLLLNSVLQALGYEAQAVLVSTYRNRAILNYLPTHAEFDHVITRVNVDGQYYLLDPTISSQGNRLDTRGYIDYGAGLIVGNDNPPQKLNLPLFAKNELAVEQSWDFGQLRSGKVPVSLVIRGKGMSADNLRRMIYLGQTVPWLQYIQNRYTRSYEGLKLVGDVKWEDDRSANVLTGKLQFEYEGKLRYEEGRLLVEMAALELIDYLQGPPEPSRTMPFYLEDRSTQRYSLRVRPPYKILVTPQADRQFGDDYIDALASVSAAADQEPWVQFDWTLRYRSDEVLPGQASRFRERMVEMRKNLVRSFRLPLWDVPGKRSEFETLSRQVAQQMSKDRDRLDDIRANYEFDLKFGELAQSTAWGTTRLVAEINTQMAIAAKGLGRPEQSLPLLDQADQLDPASAEERSNERISTYMMLSRKNDALAVARQFPKISGEKADYWPSLAEHYYGDQLKAMELLEDYARTASGEAREFCKLWLLVMAEAKTPGSGPSRLSSSDLEPQDSAGFGRELVRFFAGKITQVDLVLAATKVKRDERLNLTEAYFFIGKRLLIDGQPQEAKRFFQKAIDIKATPYREYMLAQMELQRLP